MGDALRIDGQKLDMHPRRMVAWLDAKDNWEQAKNIFPIYMELSPVGVCNHECTFCSVDYMLDREDAPRIPYDVLERTLTDMAAHSVRSVLFAGAGEPLLYKDRATGKTLADVILHADHIGLDTELTSNTVLLTEDFCERAFTAKRFRRIRTSINGGDAETYAKIHRTKNPSDFDTVLRNLERAVKIRERLGSGPLLTTQLVAVPETEGKRRRSLVMEQYPSNVHTIVPLAKRLRDIGVDNFSVKPYKQHTVELDTTRSRMYEGAAYRDIREIFREAETLQTDRFEVTIRYAAMDQQDGEDRGYHACHATPFHWAYIEADGEVWGCSAYVGRIENGREIGDHRFRFGNVNAQAFSDIWRNDRRKACWEYTRKPPSEGGLDVRQCMKGCQMDMPNRYLWQLTNPGSLVNFIK